MIIVPNIWEMLTDTNDYALSAWAVGFILHNMDDETVRSYITIDTHAKLYYNHTKRTDDPRIDKLVTDFCNRMLRDGYEYS